MAKSRVWTRGLRLVALLIAASSLLLAHSAGPDPGLSGAPGDDTCLDCHGTSLNPTGGSLKITFPSGTTYTPGQVMHLTVTLSDPTAKRWGFELSPRISSDSRSTKTDHGKLTVTDSAHTRLTSPDGTLQWISHNSNGTYANQTQQATWNLDYTPPTNATGNIDIFVAGNAANNNGREDSGDHVYTAKATLTPSATSGGPKPVISDSGVLNGGSNAPGIEAGSWVAIKGTDLASTTRIWDTSKDFVNGNLPTSLDGTSVTINNKPAYVYYISPTQVNVLAPNDSATGDVDVVVTTPNGSSSVVKGRLQTYAPAFFLFGTTKNIAALNQDNSFLVDPSVYPTLQTHKAKPGDVVALYGTGFGPTNPVVQAGQVLGSLAHTASDVTVTVGGKPATVTFSGMTSNGLYQINVQVPALPDGTAVVVATVGGQSTQSDAFIPIQN